MINTERKKGTSFVTLTKEGFKQIKLGWILEGWEVKENLGFSDFDKALKNEKISLQ